MGRRSGLGRGLGALIPAEVKGDTTSEFRDLPVAVVRPNKYQPRQQFDEAALDELTASVRELGILQPVLVRPVGEDEFELIAGERRWRAAKRAGLVTIPAIVRTVDDTTSLAQALVENIQRDDLNPLETAAAYLQLIEEFEFTHEELAARVGKSRAAVTNTLRLLQLPPAVQRLVMDDRLTAGHARALLGTPDRAVQESLARKAADEGWSVRAVEDEVRARSQRSGADGDGDGADAPAAPAAPALSKLRPPGLLELEHLLGDHLDTRVSVDLKAKKGRIVIEFADLEDLERLYRRMTEGNTAA